MIGHVRMVGGANHLHCWDRHCKLSNFTWKSKDCAQCFICPRNHEEPSVNRLFHKLRIHCMLWFHLLLFDLLKNKRIIVEGLWARRNGMYRLVTKNVIEQVNLTLNDFFLARRWYCRMEHLNWQTLHELSTSGKAHGMPYIPVLKEVCPTYKYRKQTCTTLPKSSFTQADGTL